MRYLVVVLVIVGLMSCASGRGHRCSKASKNYWHNEFSKF